MAGNNKLYCVNTDKELMVVVLSIPVSDAMPGPVCSENEELT